MKSLIVMKKFLQISLLLISIPFLAAAQTQATKIDEFEDIKCDQYLGKMDAVLIHSNDVPDQKVYIRLYEGGYTYAGGYTRPYYGQANVRIASIKKYIRYRKVPLDRFIFVKG